MAEALTLYKLIILTMLDRVDFPLTGDGPRNLLIAPLWSTDKKRVLNTIQKRFRERDMWQGKYYQ